MGLLLKSAFFGLFLFVASQLWRMTPILGIARTIYHHAPGHCRLVDGIENGSEDIATLANGLAFFTSGLDFPVGHLKYPVIGRIYTFDFNHPDEKPKALKIEGLDSINPNGLALWENNEGEVFVFVVNHPPNGEEYVDKFLFNPKTNSLLHKMRVSSNEHGHMELVNDLVVVGENQFYFTNYLSKKLPATVQMLGLAAWGSIVYFDGQKTSLVQDNLLMPNGINISPDKKFIYVSHIGYTEILVFEVQSAGSLSLKNKIHVGTMADNLDVDPETGSIWTGAHPKFFDVVGYLDDPRVHRSASQVLKVNVQDGNLVNITEVFADDGSMISGTTSAVHYKNAMLVGTIFTNLMYCEVN